MRESIGVLSGSSEPLPLPGYHSPFSELLYRVSCLREEEGSGFFVDKSPMLSISDSVIIGLFEMIRALTNHL